MSLFGYNASKNPPNLTNTDDANLSTATVNELTVVDKLYFKQLNDPMTGNLAFNMSVDETTDDLTINTPQLSKIKFVLGTDPTHQQNIFTIAPTEFNLNINNGTTPATITYDELYSLDGIASNVQTQINTLSAALASSTGYWGEFAYDLANMFGTSIIAANPIVLNYANANNNGVSLSTPVSGTSPQEYNTFTVANTGVYTITARFNATLSTGGPTSSNVQIWLRKNGSDLKDSRALASIQAVGRTEVITYTYINKFTAGDVLGVQFIFGATQAYFINYSSSTVPPSPVSPACYVTVSQTSSIGPAGPQGPAGPAATIAVGTTTTLPAGSSATVSNSGTSSAAVFNFAIPQGPQGVQGPQGPTGPDGGAAGFAAQAANSAANALTSANNAATAESNASNSAANALTSANNAATSANNASTSANNAQTSANNASSSANSAGVSAGAAATSAGLAGGSAVAAAGSALAASGSATAAGGSATAAGNSATAAGNSATAAQNSATDAQNSADDAANSATSVSEKTKNITTPTAVGLTNFTGGIDVEALVVYGPAYASSFTNTSLTVNTSAGTAITAGTSANITAASTVSVMANTSVTIASPSGAGASINIGGYLDNVNVNGIPFSLYFQQF
jgi:hypothetical protein